MTPAEVSFDTGSKSWKREFQVVLATGHQHTNSRRCHLWAVNQRSPSHRFGARLGAREFAAAAQERPVVEATG